MRIPLKVIDEYLFLNPEREINPNAPHYILRHNLSKDVIKELKELNNFYKKCYGNDVIAFS